MRFVRIKGDGPQNLVRLPRLGKIRLGVKAVSKSGKEYPREVSYFVCPPEVQQKYGPQPTSLPVMLATEDDEQSYRQYFAVYGSNQRLKCQGDGEAAERRNEKGEKEKIACPSPDRCEYGTTQGCRTRFDLMVVLPDVSVGGVYQISTGSTAADIDIRSGILMARSLYGRASWVPMELVREPVKMLEPGSTKMQTHYIVRLRPIGNLETVMAVRKDPTLIPTAETARYLLPEPVIEGPEPDTPIVNEQETSLEEMPAAPQPVAEREPTPTPPAFPAVPSWSAAAKDLADVAIVIGPITQVQELKIRGKGSRYGVSMGDYIFGTENADLAAIASDCKAQGIKARLCYREVNQGGRTILELVSLEPAKIEEVA